LETLFVQPGFFMTVLYLEAPAAIAVSLSVLMAGARVMRLRAGNSGWVDTIWTFSLGFAGTGSVLRPVVGLSPMQGNGWSRPWQARSRPEGPR
jgi:steroid 5-alpha reductase family enzyme